MLIELRIGISVHIRLEVDIQTVVTVFVDRIRDRLRIFFQRCFHGVLLRHHDGISLLVEHRITLFVELLHLFPAPERFAGRFVDIIFGRSEPLADILDKGTHQHFGPLLLLHHAEIFDLALRKVARIVPQRDHIHTVGKSHQHTGRQNGRIAPAAEPPERNRMIRLFPLAQSLVVGFGARGLGIAVFDLLFGFDLRPVAAVGKRSREKQRRRQCPYIFLYVHNVCFRLGFDTIFSSSRKDRPTRCPYRPAMPPPCRNCSC